MKSSLINPSTGIYPATDYAHGNLVTGVEKLLFVSGTMGLSPDQIAPASLSEQLVLVWENLRRILDEAGMGVDNIVRLTSYMRDGSYAEANRDARLYALGGRRIPTTAIVVETLEPNWLIEIEVIAAA
ncbi:RidA family protein [Nisaea sp.]|uniref:RidA family protein n=1 Tax=Nisaea sp. TaxID=2024842 RepID=UPI003299CE80